MATNTTNPGIENLVERLRNRSVSLREIHEQTGLGWHWLRAMSEGRIPSPGYDKVLRLTAYLDSHDSKGNSPRGVRTEA